MRIQAAPSAASLGEAMSWCRKRFAGWLFAIVAPFVQADSVAASLPPQQVAQIESIVAAWMQAHDVPGLSLAIRRHGQTAFARGFGIANRATGEAASAHTIYPIGSISKQFAAAAVLMLADEGRLRRNGLLQQHLPAISPREPVTLEQLLRHTAGVREFFTLPAFGRLEADRSARIDDLLGEIAREPLGFVPGTRWSYSNTNYHYAARVIEAVAGQPYERVLAARLFKPLALNATRHCPDVPKLNRLAAGYAWRDGKLVDAAWENMQFARGDGGLCSSAIDLVRWADALPRGQPVPRRVYEQMTQATVLADGSVAPYGAGLVLLALDGEPRIGHNGAIGGYSAALSRYPRRQLAIAALSNRSSVPVDGLEHALARLLLNHPAPTWRDEHVAPELRAALIGDWDIGVAGLIIRIVADGDGLRIESPPPGLRDALRHQGGGRFVVARAPDAGGVHLVGPAGHERLLVRMGGMLWIGERLRAAAAGTAR